MGSYEECISFLSSCGIKLFDYQEQMLKAFIENKTVRSARGIGRTFVADCYGKYISSILSKNDYSKEPDVVFPYDVAVKCGLWSEGLIQKLRGTMEPAQFDKEFLCK